MGRTVISVDHISKQYRLGQLGTGFLAHDINRWWYRIRGKEDPYIKIGDVNDRSVKGKSSYVWALQDVSFQVTEGEVLGIIGKNGAGKSTLLKILSRTTAPTKGNIRIKGRVASLLEVGTGFHPELTGRENIFLNGAIMGMSRKEISRKFDEIVDFAGVEKYLETPVKRYSSGMHVRLAFAVAAHLDPEILILDEVLAVGDAEFQKKCLGKMRDVSQKYGRTVLFVSHDMNAIVNLCSRVIVMEKGTVVINSNTNQAVAHYINNKMTSSIMWSAEEYKPQLHFRQVDVELSGDQPNLLLRVRFTLSAKDRHKNAMVAFDITNSIGAPVMQAIPQSSPFIQFTGQDQTFICDISLDGLIPDIYYLSAWVGEHYHLVTDLQKEILSFEVITSPIPGRTVPHSYSNGYIIARSTVRKMVEVSV